MHKVVIGYTAPHGLPESTVTELPMSCRKFDGFLRDWESLRKQGYTWFSFEWAEQICTYGRGKGARSKCQAKLLGYWV